jgi:small subunit ribosomal protein S9
MAEAEQTVTIAAPAPSAPQPLAQPAPAPVKKVAAKKKGAQRKGKGSFVKSKRKQAIARASGSTGKGKITINGFDINTIEPVEFKGMMMEPVNFSDTTRGVASKMDIKVNVYGGGASAQAQAVRSAIAKSIIEFSGADSLKKAYMHYDRFMVVDDSRRIEPKKFKGPKARARFQKSYR